MTVPLGFHKHPELLQCIFVCSSDVDIRQIARLCVALTPACDVIFLNSYARFQGEGHQFGKQGVKLEMHLGCKHNRQGYSQEIIIWEPKENTATQICGLTSPRTLPLV